MSFTLRNLFSEEDGDPESDWVVREGEGESRTNSPPGLTKATPEDQAYLVSELLPFIPPAIAASGSVPMEKEVHLPIGKNGSPDVRLSAIFQQCPELFDAEITPLNDSTVTLPVKLGKAQAAAKVGSSIFDAPVTPFGAPWFGMPASDEVDVSVDESEDNPFWSPGPDETAKAEGNNPAADTGFSGGFSASPPAEVFQKDEGNAFGEPAPSAKEVSMPSTDPMAGFGAPSRPKTPNPFGDTSSAPAESKSSPFTGNPFDSNESFSTLFSTKAEEDSDIPFPGSGGNESTWGAMFNSDAEVDSEATSEEVPGLGEMLKRNDVSNRATELPEPAVESRKTAAEVAPPAESLPVRETPPKTPAISFSVEKPSDCKGPVPPLEESEMEESSSPGPEVTARAEARNFNSVREAAPPPLEESSLKVEEEKLAPSTSAPTMPGEMEVNFKDLEFRAIFSSDDSFTLAKVARQLVAFEGVCACALATPAKLVQASRNEQSRLGDEAREMVDAIRNLAKLTGLPEARAFTLQTDRGTVSLFLEGDCCVTVNHQSSGFGPGVREKLILIARNIHKLNE